MICQPPKQHKRSIFKKGDEVSYGALDGVIIGIYDGTQALFFADKAKDTLSTAKDLIVSAGKLSTAIIFMINDYFGYKDVDAATLSLLKQPRFLVVSLSDLKTKYKYEAYKAPTATITNAQSEKSLEERRHLYIRYAILCMKKQKNPEKIEQLCYRVDAIQKEIELEDLQKDTDQLIDPYKMSELAALSVWEGNISDS